MAIVAVVGSGCIIEATPNTGGVDLFWSEWWSPSLGVFGGESATATEVCTAAAVDEIELTLTDPAGYVRAHDSGPCIAAWDNPGIAYRDLEPGTWDYYLAGYRGDVRKVLVFEDVGSFEVFDGRTEVVDALPAAIYYDLRIDYTVEACAPGDTIEFDLRDVAYADPVYSAVAVSCAGASLTIPSVPWDVAGVSSGVYASSAWVQRNAAGAPVRYSTCRPTWEQLAANKTISVSLTSTTAPTTNCSF